MFSSRYVVAEASLPIWVDQPTHCAKTLVPPPQLLSRVPSLFLPLYPSVSLTTATRLLRIQDREGARLELKCKASSLR